MPAVWTGTRALWWKCVTKVDNSEIVLALWQIHWHSRPFWPLTYFRNMLNQTIGSALVWQLGAESPPSPLRWLCICLMSSNNFRWHSMLRSVWKKIAQLIWFASKKPFEWKTTDLYLRVCIHQYPWLLIWAICKMFDRCLLQSYPFPPLVLGNRYLL